MNYFMNILSKFHDLCSFVQDLCTKEENKTQNQVVTLILVICVHEDVRYIYQINAI